MRVLQKLCMLEQILYTGARPPTGGFPRRWPYCLEKIPKQYNNTYQRQQHTEVQNVALAIR